MMSDVIFHIDVNSAYLSWTSAHMLESGETLDLRAIPSIIGGDEKKPPRYRTGEIGSGKSIRHRDRRTGGCSAEKCPMLTIAPPDHTLYAQYSRRLMELLHTYTSDIEKLSVDECFLYYTPVAHRFPRAWKRHIRSKTGFAKNSVLPSTSVSPPTSCSQNGE